METLIDTNSKVEIFHENSDTEKKAKYAKLEDNKVEPEDY
jgi:hypothetical protein